MSVETSVIIVNYNTKNVLCNCVDSIINNIEMVETIVVDNASEDNSIKYLLTKNTDNDIVVILNKINVGFAAACNIGMKKATGEYILYINPDCILEQNALGVMLDHLKKNPDVGMAGGLILNPDGSEQVGGRRAVPTPWRSFVRAFGLSRLEHRYPKLFTDFLLHRNPLPETPIEVEAISGACMMVRREALEDVGPLDEGYFMHCEDLDWCMRFRQKGWKIAFVPQARITHLKGASSRTRPIFVEWHKHKGMMRFYRKFFRHQYPGILMWLVGLGVWLRFGVLVVYYSFRNIGKRAGLLHDTAL